MTIEIKELVIRAVVDPAGGGSEKPQKNAEKGQPASDETVAECVEQVLEILRRQRER